MAYKEIFYDEINLQRFHTLFTYYWITLSGMCDVFLSDATTKGQRHHETNRTQNVTMPSVIYNCCDRQLRCSYAKGMCRRASSPFAERSQ